MRNTTRHIPAGYAKHVDIQELGLEVYLKDADDKGYSYTLGYAGKAVKPAFHYRWKDATKREEFLTKFIAGRQEIADDKRKRAEARKNFVHSLKEGDVLVASWGWEQTNVDFYQVTKVIGKLVEVREIAQKVVEETGPMSETVVAVKDRFVGGVERHKVRQGDRVSLTSYKNGGLWDGRALHQSHYA